jgi:hypothetical protein
MRKQIEQELGPGFSLFGMYVSEEESKLMDERGKLVEQYLDAINEIIFNMFAKGFNNKTIAEIVPNYSTDVIAALREKWEKNKAKAEGVAEGEQKKEKEIIFNMFAKGLDDELISICSSHSIEDIVALREEWLEKIHSEEDN